MGPLDADAGTALLAACALERGADVARDPALPELVRRLDGIPLALELAAQHTRLDVLAESIATRSVLGSFFQSKPWVGRANSTVRSSRRLSIFA